MACLWSTLKSCSFPIRRPGEIKNSHEPPAGRNLLCNPFVYKVMLQKDLKRQAADTVKILLYIYLNSIFMFNFYIDV